MTCLLEEERKRRASIEQASLQRIAELEAQVMELLSRFTILNSFHKRFSFLVNLVKYQVQKEQRKSTTIVKHLQLM